MKRTSSKSMCVLTVALMIVWTVVLNAGTTGKIAGRVVDNKTGNPLPGANVILVGTTMGAATDADGEYFIINVPPGVYSLRAQMIGFKAVVITEVRVQVDLTTHIDFESEEEVLRGEEVTIISERPIVEMDVTGSSHRIDASAIQRAPVISLRDVLSQQSGFYDTGETTFVRGGLSTELNYRLDGISLNSGLLSDNWQRLNTTAIEEISVLTGGYNAEYGNAMSGVVNVVTKQASVMSRSLNGQVQYRVRPSGKFHWGRNMYDQTLWKTTNFGLDFWQNRLQDEGQRIAFAQYFQRFLGWDGQQVPTAQELLDTYRQQIDPADALGDYANRAQHQVEATLYGSPLNKVSFLLSGRYLRGVGIYPQSNAYNPEYNLQGKLSYHLSSNKKLTLNLLRGRYESSTYTESNWNNFESAKEARWQPNADVRGPYDNKAYAPWGGYWLKGPETKTINLAGLQWKHALNASTFYEVEFSYFSDKVTELQEYDKLNTSEEVLPWGDSMFDLAGNFRLEARQIQVNNYTKSEVLTIKSDLTSQIHKSHQMKLGFDFKRYALDYQHYYMEFPAGDVWHLDNVWDGTPVEGALYAQDKMEFGGMIVNLGVRFDAYNTQSKFAENIYDPLGFQEHNGGDGTPTNTAPIWQAHRPGKDWFAKKQEFESYFEGKLNDRQTVNSDWKLALSPRIGIAFPITDNSKLRFSYGHFNQRASWAKLMGFPTSWFDSAPFASVRMDQWQGWYGQPGLSFEKVIQYELGYTQSLFDVFGLDVTGYYKDASGLTRFSHNSTYNRGGGGFAVQGWGEPGVFETYSRARNIANDGHDNIFYTNNAFKDIRGIEADIEKHFRNRWGARLSMDYSVSSGGAAGFWYYREDAGTVNQPSNFDELKVDWLSSYVIKGSFNYMTPANWAKGVLGNISIGLFNEYFSGPLYTWYPRDFTGLQEPNNKRWFAHRRTDLEFSKRFKLAGFTQIFALEVFNLFNNKDRILLRGSDLDNWEENGEIPKISKSGEENIWEFYNSISNPRRMLYISLGVEF